VDIIKLVNSFDNSRAIIQECLGQLSW